jgi:uroporphyrinogen decarboxylase
VPASEFESWVVSPTARIVAGVKAEAPEIPIIGFARGIGPRLPDYVCDTGIDAVGLDSAISPAEAAISLQPLCPVQGNLDPAYLLAGGAEMERAAHAVLEALSGGPFIFNLAHGINKETPPAHVERLAEIIRDWGTT